MTDKSTSSAKMDEQPEQILLVDDNTMNLQVLHQTLDGRGYKLLIAKNGETALVMQKIFSAEESNQKSESKTG